MIAFLNWYYGPKEIDAILEGLPLPKAGAYHAVDFWNGSYQRIEAGKATALDVPAHGVRLLALRPVQDLPAWVGDTLHISQGMAVKRWSAGSQALRAELDLGRQAEGTIWIALQARPQAIILNGNALPWREAGHGVYAVDVSFEGLAVLEINWD